MDTQYQSDVVAWAHEQAQFIRAGKFDRLDLTHLAEEIEDVGKSEQRELASRMAVLLAHLIKWQHQPSKQSKSWMRTLRIQRKEIEYALGEAPSLRTKFNDSAWLAIVWAKAIAQAENETGLDLETLPDALPWAVSDVLQDDWYPSAEPASANEAPKP
jgi:hypothetical protein